MCSIHILSTEIFLLKTLDFSPLQNYLWLRKIESVNQEEKLQNHKIAVVATTCYKKWSADKIGITNNADQLRNDLAIETIWLVKEKGYQLVVADGGSLKNLKTL